MSIVINNNLPSSTTLTGGQTLQPYFCAVGFSEIVGMVGPRPEPGERDLRRKAARRLLKKMAEVRVGNDPLVQKIGSGERAGDWYSPPLFAIHKERYRDRGRREIPPGSGKSRRAAGNPARAQNSQDSPENNGVSAGNPAARRDIPPETQNPQDSSGNNGVVAGNPAGRSGPPAPSPPSPSLSPITPLTSSPSPSPTPLRAPVSAIAERNLPPEGLFCPVESEPWRLVEDWVWAGLALPLQTDKFRNAFARWVLMRQQVGRISPISVRAKLGELAALGHDRAVAALIHSVANGYSGVHEPKNGTRQTSPANRPPVKKSKTFDF